jgi:dipeptidyl aminopeptidase/acylaminoacyl peptidase
VVAVAASPFLRPAVVALDLEGAAHRVLRDSGGVPVGEDDISVGRPIEFPTTGAETAHAIFYEPRNSSCTGMDGELPPLIVMIHGGPTSSASGTLNLRLQFWTNRGFAVADVDYRGSSGYGRPYRERLRAMWGVSDVEDCASVVSWLQDQGLADGSRAVIRGSSAGGFTTLAALAFTDAFAAGASLFGIGDLETLARETHKFESRYTDGLVGPWPAAADEYRRRSPIHHVDAIRSPLILFHGREDMVVPVAQSEQIYEALVEARVPVAFVAFEGEQHGFRKAETLVTVMGAELEFYGRVLGFPTPGTGLRIVNEEWISPRA